MLNIRVNVSTSIKTLFEPSGLVSLGLPDGSVCPARGLAVGQGRVTRDSFFPLFQIVIIVTPVLGLGSPLIDSVGIKLLNLLESIGEGQCWKPSGPDAYAGSSRHALESQAS